MFKYTKYNFDVWCKILILYLNNNIKQFIANNNIIHYYVIHKKFNKSLYTNNTFFIDFLSSQTKNTTNSILGILLLNKNKFIFITLYWHMQLKWKSKSIQQPIWEWYEREISEKSLILITNLSDTRELLNYYSDKLVNKQFLYQIKQEVLTTNFF